MIVVTVARRPLGKKTVAANVLEHGTGAMNIDASRIATTETWSTPDRVISNSLPGDERTVEGQGMFAGGSVKPASQSHPGGRHPANVILSEAGAADLDATTRKKPRRFFRIVSPAPRPA